MPLSVAKYILPSSSSVIERTALLRKGELHRLVALVPPDAIVAEVKEKLDLLASVFPNPGDDASEVARAVVE